MRHINIDNIALLHGVLGDLKFNKHFHKEISGITLASLLKKIQNKEIVLNLSISNKIRKLLEYGFRDKSWDEDKNNVNAILSLLIRPIELDLPPETKKEEKLTTLDNLVDEARSYQKSLNIYPSATNKGVITFLYELSREAESYQDCFTIAEYILSWDTSLLPEKYEIALAYLLIASRLDDPARISKMNAQLKTDPNNPYLKFFLREVEEINTLKFLCLNQINGNQTKNLMGNFFKREIKDQIPILSIKKFDQNDVCLNLLPEETREKVNKHFKSLSVNFIESGPLAEICLELRDFKKSMDCILLITDQQEKAYITCKYKLASDKAANFKEIFDTLMELVQGGHENAYIFLKNIFKDIDMGFEKIRVFLEKEEDRRKILAMTVADFINLIHEDPSNLEKVEQIATYNQHALQAIRQLAKNDEIDAPVSFKREKVKQKPFIVFKHVKFDPNYVLLDPELETSLIKDLYTLNKTMIDLKALTIPVHEQRKLALTFKKIEIESFLFHLRKLINKSSSKENKIKRTLDDLSGQNSYAAFLHGCYVINNLQTDASYPFNPEQKNNVLTKKMIKLIENPDILAHFHKLWNALDKLKAMNQLPLKINIFLNHYIEKPYSKKTYMLNPKKIGKKITLFNNKFDTEMMELNQIVANHAHASKNLSDRFKEIIVDLNMYVLIKKLNGTKHPFHSAIAFIILKLMEEFQNQILLEKCKVDVNNNNANVKLK